ncbi:MAG: EamA family transporter [Candidatus Omnitrophica bacterium]|nr:EamA family transporter [Candidatus Omnitrophota bacterium]MDD5236529.1 EamA family transporter [Candidatus Omnitrophota bacterium]MDD5610739.1 EamA family transporter [Candidatus Omnitrophota bacterium]
MRKSRVTLKIILFLILTDVLETLAHYFFKRTALPESGLIVSNALDAFVFMKAVVSSGFLWLGIVIVATEFVFWSTILSKIDLSVAVPIASFSYIMVPLVSVIALHEKISLLRWSGIFFIMAGVIFVSLSTKDRGVASE